MSRIWAVARQTVAEAMRMRVAVVFMVLLGGLLLGLPFAEGDGTLPGRVQAFLTYSVSAAFVLVAVLTIFLGCSTIANEIRDRQIHTIACKPIPRWQYFAGKWLGVVVFDLGLLAVSGLAIYVSVYIVRNRPQYDEAARQSLDNQVLTARFATGPTKPDFGKFVEQRFQRLREQGPLPEFVVDPDNTTIRLPGTERNVKKNIRHDLEMEWTYVRPTESRTFVFHNLLIDRSPDKRIYIRYKIEPERLPPDLLLTFGWTVGDRAKGASSFAVARNDVVSRFHEIEFPATAVAADQSLTVTFHNFNVVSRTVDFPTAVHLGRLGKIEVLFPVGSFEGNLFRGLGIIFCVIVFLAAFSVFTSTWLSFPVACLVSMFVFVIGMSMGFLSESILATVSTNTGEEATGLVFMLLKPMGLFVLLVMPDFSGYSPMGVLADGRVVTLVWLLRAIGNLVLFRGMLIGLIGALIFHNRELAKVTA